MKAAIKKALSCFIFGKDTKEYEQVICQSSQINVSS